MKKLILLSFLMISIFTNAQLAEADTLKTILLSVKIEVVDLDKSYTSYETFIQKHNVIPDRFKKDNYKFEGLLHLNKIEFDEIQGLFENWGAIAIKEFSSLNYKEKIDDVNKEISRLEVYIKEYKALLNQVDPESQNYILYWQKLESTKDLLNKELVKLANYKQKVSEYSVSFVVREQNYLSNEPDFSFINMPGLQYSYFLPANTAGGLYPKSMSGYSIKYLMNRRKTYLEISLFQANDKSEKLYYNEFYKFGIGQDFYSSHLGRGTRNFLNLYSGLNVGFVIFSGDNFNTRTWYATPSIGLEIYKNKYIMLETKTGYFLPFKENRNLRGLLFEASFSVVF